MGYIRCWGRFRSGFGFNHGNFFGFGGMFGGLGFGFNHRNFFGFGGLFRGLGFCRSRSGSGSWRYRPCRGYGFSAGFAEFDAGRERRPAMNTCGGLLDSCATCLAKLNSQGQWLVTMRAG